MEGVSILVLVFGFTVTSVSGQSNVANCSLAGQCLESIFITEDARESAQECLEHCQDTGPCHWFTYKPVNSLCQLFETCESISDDNCPDCITGQKECDSVYQCNVQGRCQGVFDADSTTDTAEDCADDCKNNPDCKWYTFDSQFSECLQFQTCTSIDRNCTACTSSQVECEEGPPPPIVYTKILVTTGNPIAPDEPTEIIDVSGQNLNCEFLDPFPTAIDFATGGLLNGTTPIVCGGNGIGMGMDGYLDECWVYIKGVGYQSTGDSKMSSHRSSPAGVIVRDNEFLVTGGSDTYGHYNISDFVSPGNPTRVGPDMLEPLYRHCITKINDSLVAVAGGIPRSGFDYSSTFFLNLDTEVWTEGPALNLGRFYPSCGVIGKNNGKGDKYMVVAAGLGDDALDDTNNVEFLDLQDPNAVWKQGPPLPHTTIFSGQMVSANDHSAVYYLGGWLGSDIGQTNQVYKMTCSNNQDDSCAWEDLGGLMDHPRDDFVTMFVPDDLATCS